ncbi:MAG TPA: SWIM zinc finger family protein [Kofleriaceae bacterium]|jgi:hypothetical protein|nr:SWIM zinc finger family protein [Kofleriaceae bacterium]
MARSRGDRQRAGNPVGSAGVSLAAQLTHRHLCELGVAYLRGEAYFDEGRVQALVVTAGAVEGTVSSSAAYRVRIELASDELRSACTCPVGAGCKHVVALGLAYLTEQGGSTEPERSPGASCQARGTGPAQRGIRGPRIAAG